MTPGAIALTRMPCIAHSTASVFVMLSTPARAAPVCTIPGNPSNDLRDDVHDPAAFLRESSPWSLRRASCVHVPMRLLRTTAVRNPSARCSRLALGNWPHQRCSPRTSMRLEPLDDGVRRTPAIAVGFTNVAGCAECRRCRWTRSCFDRGVQREAQGVVHRSRSLAPRRTHLRGGETRPIPVPPPVMSTTSSIEQRRRRTDLIHPPGHTTRLRCGKAALRGCRIGTSPDEVRDDQLPKVLSHERFRERRIDSELTPCNVVRVRCLRSRR